MEEKVSVVIPVYNSEKFLEESIKSVLSQTYQNLEVIAVDDGSTDKSLEILKKFQNKIKIVHQENKGLADALNTGIKRSTGNWIKWFSPDDLMYSYTISTLVDMAKSLNGNTIIYSNWNIIDDSGKLLRTFKESNYNNLDSFDYNVRLLDGQQINVNTSLFPSILVKTLQMNSLIDPVLVDYDFFLRAGMLQNTKFYLIEKPLIEFRIHEKQLSHQNIYASLNNLKSVREEILSQISKEKQDWYKIKLAEYKKKKPLSKKSLEIGLKFISLLLPNKTTDRILVFYLNKIRRTRS